MSIYKTTIFTFLTTAIKKETGIKEIKELFLLIKQDDNETTTTMKVLGLKGETYSKHDTEKNIDSINFLIKIKPFIKNAVFVDSVLISQIDGVKTIKATTIQKDGTKKITTI